MCPVPVLVQPKPASGLPQEPCFFSTAGSWFALPVAKVRGGFTSVSGEESEKCHHYTQLSEQGGYSSLELGGNRQGCQPLDPDLIFR